ncbi:MAG TPA: AlkA N-terminal domain-containing protein [Roseiflexaceae bacterium]|nr:AlkA N-terminal domain-containing protein [Roseiflexaceae bacterium]
MAGDPTLLSLRGPFDFARSIRFWRRSTGELCEQWADGVYRRVVEQDGSPAVLALHSAGTVEAPAVRLELDGRPATAAETVRLAGLVRHMLGDDLDLRACYAALAGDEALAPVFARLYGLRAPRSPLWETLCFVIAGQQISVPFAYQLKQRLVMRYGTAFEAGGRPLYRFPAPTVLAEADPDELRGMQFSGSKARFISGLAQQIVAGKLDLERIAALPTPEATAELIRFHGIGRWTAEFLLMRALGRADALPANDAGVRQGVAALYGQRLPEAELRAFGARWGQWGGVVGLYLLAWLREEAEAKIRNA